jgi:hypothetical protein
MKVPTIIHTFGRIKGEVDWEKVSACPRIGRMGVSAYGRAGVTAW